MNKSSPIAAMTETATETMIETTTETTTKTTTEATAATRSSDLPGYDSTLSQDARVMSLVGLAHAISHFSHLLLPPFFPIFIQEFNLSYSQVGLLMTLFFTVSGVGQALSGFVVDRIGAFRVLLVSLLLFFSAALLASIANGLVLLMFAACLAGLGNAPFHPVDFTILNQKISARRLGHAYSVHGISGNLGWAAAPAFLLAVSLIFDWRVAYVAAASLYIIVLAVLWWNRALLYTKPREVTKSLSVSFALPDFMRLPVIWWCFSFFLLSTLTLAVIQTYSASILQAMHSVSLEAATLTLTAYMLCGAIGMVMGGFLTNSSVAVDRIVAGSLMTGALLLLVVASGVTGGFGAMLLLALTGFSVGIAGPSRDMMIKKATPVGATGRVYGTVYSGLDIGFALSPLLFGVMMDKAWYAATLSGAAIVLMLAVYTANGVGNRISKNH